KVLNEQDQMQLLESFANVEHDDMGPGTHEKYLAIAAKLAERYSAESQVSDSSASAGCCGHH
ncbi:MAG: hypothetical protein MI725_11625, partial [Pirellulales bacterium]|nr:hypothetical protein [Pirellulales bacterium]